MKRTIEIEVPEGKKAVWKDGRVLFIDKQPKLPKTWEEYCIATTFYKDEYFVGTNAGIIPYKKSSGRHLDYDRNLLATKEDAKAHLALIQLHRLRDCYRQGWIPTADKVSFGIARRLDGSLYIDRNMYSSRFLSFQSKEIAEEFLNNFRDLIEQARDLI